MERWSLMDDGEYVDNGYTPTEYTAWEREAMGWFEIDTLNTSGFYTMTNINEEGGKAYRIINSEDSSECFILQNIQLTGWNSKLDGHGMLVMHVDFSSSIFRNNTVNNTIGHSRMTFIPADDEYISAFQIDAETITRQMYCDNHAGDPFPGTKDVTAINEFPAYSGIMKERVYDITEHQGRVSFYFDDGTTGIKQTIISQKENEKHEIFTLDGRSMGYDYATLPKGIYIVNGQKTVIR